MRKMEKNQHTFAPWTKRSSRRRRRRKMDERLHIVKGDLSFLYS